MKAPQHRTKQRFNSATELKLLAKSLDRATETTMYKPVLDEKGQPKHHSDGRPQVTAVQGRYLIENVDFKETASATSEDYTIVQHRDVYEALADNIQTLGIPVEGWLVNDRHSVEALVTFKNSNIKDDSEKGVKLGIRVTNSYDQSNSLRGELWAYRLICSNGMRVGSVNHEATMRRLHRGTILVEKEMQNFIKKAVASEEKLQALVEENIQESLDWQYVERLLPALISTDKWRVAIKEELKREVQGRAPTRWDLYNAFTSIATNGEKVSSWFQDRLQKKAEQVLTGRIPAEADLPPLEVEAGAQNLA